MRGEGICPVFRRWSLDTGTDGLPEARNDKAALWNGLGLIVPRRE
jgi:hypothetical protein